MSEVIPALYIHILKTSLLHDDVSEKRGKKSPKSYLDMV